MKKMSSRNRVLTALRGGIPDRIPRDIIFSPQGMTSHAYKKLLKLAGGKKTREYLHSDISELELMSTKLKTNFYKYYPELNKKTYTIDEWGIAKFQRKEDGFYQNLYPMAEFTSIKEVEDYPWPDLVEDYRYKNLGEQIKKRKEAGFATMIFVPSHNYVAAWQLRGQEQFLIDILLNPELAAAIIDRTTEMSCIFAEKVAKAGIDIIYYGEDIASQKGLLMSPILWRKWLKPRLKRVIDSAHNANPNVLFKYHSDGSMIEVLPDLVEVGIDILNPLQPECNDIKLIKEKYGDKIGLWGGVGVQKTMPFGTAEDVRNEVSERITVLGRNGGYLISPAHHIEKEVPLENILAFTEAVDEFGAYN